MSDAASVPDGQGSSEPPAEDDSQLARAFSAAFHEFTQDPTAYEDLYERYLGVRVGPETLRDGEGPGWVLPKAVKHGSSLRRVLSTGVLRFGHASHRPYTWLDEPCALVPGHTVEVGFEFELGHALARVIGEYYGVPVVAEWRDVPFFWAADPSDNTNLYQTLYDGLVAGDFDMGWSGIITSQMRPETPVIPCHTLEFFTGILYTGRDEEALYEAFAGLSFPDASRADLVDWLAARVLDPVAETPTLAGTGGGPSIKGAEELAADVNAAAAALGEIPEGQEMVAVEVDVEGIKEALEDRTFHLLASDAIILGSTAVSEGAPMVNLGHSLRVDDTDFMAPFCLLDG